MKYRDIDGNLIAAPESDEFRDTFDQIMADMELAEKEFGSWVFSEDDEEIEVETDYSIVDEEEV